MPAPFSPPRALSPAANLLSTPIYSFLPHTMSRKGDAQIMTIHKQKGIHANKSIQTLHLKTTRYTNIQLGINSPEFNSERTLSESVAAAIINS